VLLQDTYARLAAGDGGVGGLSGAEALAVARRYGHGDAVGRTLGMAAINALSRCVFDRVGYVAPPSADSIGELDPHAGDHVGMVGLFTPLLGRCTAAGARVTVIELRSELAGEHDGYRVTLDPSELGRCNKVLCTSSVLLNGTVDRVLDQCAHAAQLAMIGPGAGCLPDPLFARGVTLLGGSWVTDAGGVVEALLTMARASGPPQWRRFPPRLLLPAALARRIDVDAAQFETAADMEGDPDLLAVAVANLVDNAVRHGAAYVRLTARRDAHSQRIEVADDGPGVNAERLTALSAALERFDASGEVDAMLGLGLTLAAAVARAHNGRLDLECAARLATGFCARISWPTTPALESEDGLSAT